MESGKLRYREVKGAENPADLMTKAMAGNATAKYMEKIGLEGNKGRAERSLPLRV